MQYYCITLRKEWDRKGGCSNLHMILPLRGVAEENYGTQSGLLVPGSRFKVGTSRRRRRCGDCPIIKVGGTQLILKKEQIIKCSLLVKLGRLLACLLKF